MVVELHGGPGDGKRIEFPSCGQFGLMEQRSTCPNPDHTEIRIHVYTPDGVYSGAGPWCADVQTAAHQALRH